MEDIEHFAKHSHFNTRLLYKLLNNSFGNNLDHLQNTFYLTSAVPFALKSTLVKTRTTSSGKGIK